MVNSNYTEFVSTPGYIYEGYSYSIDLGEKPPLKVGDPVSYSVRSNNEMLVRRKQTEI